MKKNYKWMKLDTAANMFASIQGKDTSRIFRISYVLKDEVKPDVLLTTVKDVIRRFPTFTSRCRSGFFWAYLEETEILPEVIEEKEMPCAIQNLGRTGGPELRVLYYKRRISVEISHVLTDGDGAFEFTKAVIAHYLNLHYKTDFKDPSVISTKSAANEEEIENAYKRYANGKGVVAEKVSGTYALPHSLDPTYTKAISGMMPISDLKEHCKKYSATVTEYLCAAAILAIINSAEKPIEDYIRISVPINLRKIFPSKTLRNFACDTTLSFNPEGKVDYTLENILNAIRGELKNSVKKETLQAFINANYSKTVNPVLRVVPYFIKKPVLMNGQLKDHQNNMTLIISNIGKVDYPDWMLQKIDRVDIISGNGSVYGLPILSTCVTVGDYLNICFTQCHRDTDFCREYFSIIAEDGVRVRVETSDGNGYSENEKNTSGKRCEKCNIDIGEEYAICPLCGEKSVNTEKKIKELITAEYPLSFVQPTHQTRKFKSAPLSVESLKAYFNI